MWHCGEEPNKNSFKIAAEYFVAEISFTAMIFKIAFIVMVISRSSIAADQASVKMPHPAMIRNIQKSPHFQKVKNDSESHGQKIVALLEEGLLDADPDSADEWFFLEKAPALKVYQEFAQSFQSLSFEDPEKPWLTHLDSLAAIAEIFFKSSFKFLESDHQFQVAIKMARELERRLEAKDCNYKWFLSFTERLEFLLTNEEHLGRAQHVFNPPFDRFQERLRVSENVQHSDGWSHETYLETHRVTGNLHTQKMASFENRVKEFPYIVSLPLPVELNAKYIFQNIPGPNQALAFKTISPGMKWTFGGFLPPHLQGSYDQKQWAILREMLSSISFLAPTSEDGFKKMASLNLAEHMWQLVLIQRQLYYKSYEIVKGMLKRSQDNPFGCKYTQKMYNFFAFYIFYHSLGGVHTTVSLLRDASKIILVGKEYKINHIKLKQMKDPRCFQNWLSADLKGLSDKQFALEFTNYANEFSQEFNGLIRNDKEYMELLNEYNSILHQIIRQGIQPSFARMSPTLYRDLEPECLTINQIPWQKYAGLARRFSSCIVQFIFDDADWTNAMPKSRPPHVVEVQIPSRLRNEAKIDAILRHLAISTDDS